MVEVCVVFLDTLTPVFELYVQRPNSLSLAEVDLAPPEVPTVAAAPSPLLFSPSLLFAPTRGRRRHPCYAQSPPSPPLCPVYLPSSPPLCPVPAIASVAAQSLPSS
ncbi:hypothetical protein Taro_032057 [Colocasia esculenta]|uniref:Uncharacterized protein n=1 Tax=Colocasia esculenta TaxID=4460 RepID=A0A843VW99_COLES|nr:hypothetical protein [Colocasia esculenta]